MALPAGEKSNSREIREALEETAHRLREHSERFGKDGQKLTQREAEKFARESFVKTEREREEK